MIAQRVGMSALRRVAGKPSVFTNQHIAKLAVASSMSTTQIRPVATAKLSVTDANEILAKQRLNRPVSPHLGIYKFEQTWFGSSIWTRITGGGLSAAFYVYFGSYLVAPLLGWHIESASLIASFSALPLAAKGGLKFLVAWPFTFHFLNGLRHLSYDLVMGFSKPDIVKWGWIIWSSSLVSALGLAFMW